MLRVWQDMDRWFTKLQGGMTGRDQTLQSLRGDVDRLTRMCERFWEGRDSATDVARMGNIPGSVLLDYLSWKIQFLPAQERGDFLRQLIQRVPEELQADFYAHYDVVRPMDYEKHPLLLRYTSRATDLRLSACRKEPFTVAWLEGHLHPGDVFYDVGANVGSYSLIAGTLVGPSGRVLAFEPGFSTYPELCWNVVINHLDKIIMPLPVALADASRLDTFHYRTLEPAAGEHTWTGEKGVYQQSLLTSGLDELIERYTLPPPNAMKIDVDGGEKAVLQGARATLAHRTFQSLIVEINDTGPTPGQDLVDIVRESGLVLASRHQRDSKAPPYLVFERAR